ncbi:hypothetical protein [Robinsoniella sp. RHS]|uniref:hypothetical protein n=1 Tax=Robinsoniella sp. RHS TaxID=1504536 RepID=UPI003750946D
MKKIGKNNPKAEQMQSDNQLRQDWNQTVDRALLGGVPETQIMNIKQMEISEKVKTLVRKEGKCPQLFANVLKGAITILQILIFKVLNAVNSSKTIDEKSAYLPYEQKKNKEIPSVPPAKSELANNFPRLQVIFEKLNNQNIAIHKKEQVLVEANRELGSVKGIFKGKQRKVLQENIGELTTQIASMKQCLSNGVRDYGYKNTKAFLADYNAAKADYDSYQKSIKKWENSTEKSKEPVSVMETLKKYKQRIKATDNKKNQVRTRSKDRGER